MKDAFNLQSSLSTGCNELVRVRRVFLEFSVSFTSSPLCKYGSCRCTVLPSTISCSSEVFLLNTTPTNASTLEKQTFERQQRLFVSGLPRYLYLGSLCNLLVDQLMFHERCALIFSLHHTKALCRWLNRTW
ncbi:uncharacterized protein LOC117647640 [Thrips palmi]|uniref:Uncharacterized protein LOC117647640 n=1 Tax=Thrips palmi TaxID=161013 RepID=A0A6P8ZQ82_THRPL|nr:uncharacterized protein LOC117647640 [Thrips palmi]